MASNAKKKTTMAKLARENAVRERRLRKQARKDARRQAAASPAIGYGDPRGDRTESTTRAAETPPTARAEAGRRSDRS